MIRKISVADLRPGMCVAEMDATVWRHMPFLYTRPGYVQAEDVERIRTEGYLETFIDTSKDLGAEEETLSEEERLDLLVGGGEPKERSQSVMRVPMPDELPRAHRKYRAVLASARRISERLLARMPLRAVEAEDAVEEVIDSVARNPSALLCLSKLHKYDRYTYTHGANVCALAVIFGSFLGLARDRLLDLGLAGLLHDAGMIVVPSEVLTRRGPLTRDEMDLIRTHPAHGRRILAESGAFSQVVLRAVAEHHEQYNGLGYPQGLRADQISLHGRVLGLCDMFDALTSDRSHAKAAVPSKALSLIYGMRGQNFVPREAELFIKCLGIYPPGSLVRLSSGDLAVVYETNPNFPLLPAVNVILDRRLRPRPPRMVDLAAHARDDSGRPRLRIVECLNPLNYMFDLRRLLGVDLALN
ncbi:HD domain-containing phosphohydrolase [Desulfovibrio aminophilus]|uniref:HD-GYP domain-containing protein n=1 Tax=Desulfovibrio aminophilus TaxID=81425 RepID=UPI0033968338